MLIAIKLLKNNTGINTKFKRGVTMKLLFTKICHDKYNYTVYNVGDVVEFTKDRAKEILTAGNYAKEVKEEVKEKAQPKKRASRIKK